MKARHVTKTKMNDESSRSHMIFAMLIRAENLQTGKVPAPEYHPSAASLSTTPVGYTSMPWLPSRKQLCWALG